MTALIASAVACRISPQALRCEHLTNPLGITRTIPEFSWQVKAGQGVQNTGQTAYRIIVASDTTLLKPGKADLWDSGRVVSADTFGITYGGKKLGADQHAVWKVRVWDDSGTGSRWSKAAVFSTGLLTEKDWQAKWIAIDAPDSLDHATSNFDGASWIWSQDQAGDKIPVGEKTFTKGFELSEGQIAEAEISITADDQFQLTVNGKKAAESDGKEDAWRRPVLVNITKLLKPGQNTLSVTAENTSVGYAGLLAKLHVRFTDGAEQVVVSDAEWQSQDGQTARVVNKYGDMPWGKISGFILRPATYYREGFEAKPALKRATAYVTALGLVDFYLNGKKVSDDLFTPGWTDYDKRVYARAYDVTKLVKSGGNAAGAVLGDGWYSGYVGYGGERAHYGDRPRVKVQLNLEYADGTHQTVATDTNWRASTGGTIEQDFLQGETFDARREPYGWSTAAFNDAKWVKPYEAKGITAVVEGHPGPPVKPYARLAPKTIKKVGHDTYILNFGQNLAGFAEIAMQGQPGCTVKIRYGERLDDKGQLYTDNLRSARATDLYTFKSDQKERWSPTFTFHGYQYMEISGLGRAPKKSEIKAVAISSATPEVGHIETSDPMINQLASNAWWTQKMNFIDVPTDCPQRDERLGWTGDAQAYIHTAAHYSDVQGFFGKWLIDLQDAQRADGQFPMVAPLKVAGDDGGPAWADAGVICPWEIYNVYGDKRELAERYESMKKFVDFCRDRSTPDLLPPAKYHCFGDWVSINADTPSDVIYESYFAGSARIVAEAAEVLGKNDDAQAYGDLADKVKAAFNKAYVSPEGVVKGDTQCAYVLALAFDLLDAEKAKIAADRLVEGIKSRGWHLSTGFVGTRDLMRVLSKVGRNDVAFRLLHTKTFPSWGFQIANGATSIWERWDGWTPEHGFQTPVMNSFAHYAYGAVMGWVFDEIGGITPLEPGYGKVRIAPHMDPGLSFAKTQFDSIRGVYSCSWKREGEKVSMTVEVPANCRAVVDVPGRGEQEVGSGTYTF